MSKQIKIFIIITLIFGFYSFTFFNENVTASPGEIYVYSPSSGQTYYQGQTISIFWTSSNAGNYVKIELIRSGYLYTITDNTTNDGSYYWILSSGFKSSSSYRIKVSSLSDSSAYDSSSYFTISERSITVTSPSGSDEWYTESTYSIRWSSNQAGTSATIELYKGDSYVSTMTHYVNNYGNNLYYSWFISSDILAGSNYRIKIISNTYSSVYDYSDYFSISERKITVNSPDNGDIWYIGSTYSINWNAGNAGNYVRIKLYKGGYYYSNIDTYAYNDGKFDWKIPSNVAIGSNYKIRVESYQYTNVYDESDTFSIDERYINVVNPNNQNIWFPNETYTISWNSKNAGENVEIKLYKNNVFASTIISDTPNNGNFNWEILDIFSADSDYKIRIKSRTYSTLYGDSNYFSIGKRSFTITYPADEEVLEKGSTYTITWDSENVGEYVDIELYKNGKYHSTIVSDYYSQENIYLGGSYIWKVPSDLTPGESYQIKISSTTYSGIETFTDGYIIIEDGLLQKISGPIIVLFVFLLLILLTIIILKIRKKRAIQNGADLNESYHLVESSKKIEKVDIGSEEYNKIWEENNF